MLRVTTWNMKQAIAPRKPLPQLWAWAASSIDPDVAVFTEAKVPKTGVPAGWSAVWDPDGIGPRRRWGTVLAARGVGLRAVTEVRGTVRSRRLTPTWPGTTVVADIIRDGERWATVVGLYGLTVNLAGERCGHGRYSVPRLLADLDPLLSSRRGQRVIVAGDFNLWPRHMPDAFSRYGLVDLVEATRDQRPPLDRCASCTRPDGPTRVTTCGHLWTHRNGTKPGAAVQQIDFILATEPLLGELRTVYGGVRDFPDAWEVSDHAPVVAEFD